VKVGSLFSGIGGFDLGLERAGMHIEWQVENNDWCREVLKKHWPKVPCHYDIRQIDWAYIPRVDLVCGGFPCQPFSVAGKQRGQNDDRYLWPEVVRCLDALRPTWFLGENVPGLINLALDQVWTDLESLSYQVWTVCLPACAVDAPHIRQRVWILGYSHANRQPTMPINGEMARVQGHVADTESMRLEGRGNESKGNRQRRSKVEPMGSGGTRYSGWLAEPELGRSSDGLPRWLDGHIGKGMSYAESQRALKTLRAMWKPYVAEAIWRTVGGLDRISQAEVLFALVREYKKDAHQTRLLLASEEALETFVRGVWRATTAARPSCRSGQVQQRPVEHSDALQVVPQFSPCDTETPWPVLGWEDGIARVASGIDRRVDRLKGLGNAVVPAVVETLGRMILHVEQTHKNSSDLA